MIATPILALVTDVKTAILLTLAPNIAVNLWSLIRGGNWLDSVVRFWPVAGWMLVGSALGTLVLVAMDPNPFRLLLAATVVLYLLSDQIKRINWNWIGRHPKASGAGAGLLGGLLGGTVNVGGPVMMIYFLELRLAPVVLVQAINLCFLLGKGTQAVTFALLGMLGPNLLLLSLPLGITALIGLRGGMWLRERVAADTYRGWLKGLLWVLSILLVVQFLRALN
ncbi:hypothetical protein SAMN05421693_10888 [Ectothiorhodospira magna]|uniref:Probable membrane transporter protein n=2 Tax=Ectothiorhodospira magna TaxID=867345 RepID=A0A1H9BD90_9GAMM|nr:hypothetical protein SAMN05421693_10888 [Ectothiorhodospira magna]